MVKEELIIKDLYEVHDGEKIWSKWYKRYLTGNTDKHNYSRVKLSCIDGKHRSFYIHRVIWYLLNGVIPEDKIVNHIDENPQNNHISNLNLMSQKENVNWGTGIERNIEKHFKPVIGYNDNGEIIYIFKSIKEAKRHGFCHSAISECCNGKRIRHKGLHWEKI